MNTKNLGISIFLLVLTSMAIVLTQSHYADAESLDDRVNEVSHSLMCPVCQGQSVAESNSNLAQDMRQIIRKKLQEGESKEQIIAYFVNRYGETILAAPPAKGMNWLLWILPALAVVAGGLGIGLFLYKSGSGKQANKSNPDEITKVTDSDYMKQIDEELTRHES
ncbi:MAG: cytochrome c-type biogenesis protein CcmH [Deltaproteobacteria bacterium]